MRSNLPFLGHGLYRLQPGWRKILEKSRMEKTQWGKMCMYNANALFATYEQKG